MRLAFELVPQSCWYSNVRSNVTRASWDRIQSAVSARAGGRCTICGRMGVQWPVEAHEVWSYDQAARTQKLTGLIALCPKCHGVKHIGRAIARNEHELLLAWYCHVNGVTPNQAIAHLKDALAINAARSSMSWCLDISYLKHYGVVLDPSGREVGLL